MQAIKKYSLLALICCSFIGLSIADPIDNQNPLSNAPINTDLSVYSDTTMSASNVVSKSKQDPLVAQVQQLQQTVAQLQDRVAIQEHLTQQLQLRLQAVEIALGQSPESQKASIGDQKKNPAISSDNNNMASATNESSNDAADDQALYKLASQQLQGKHYEAAADLLQQYIQKYPAGLSIAQAHYWLGEIYAINGNNQLAQKEFSTVTNQYSQSDMAPNAMLKLGTLAYSNADYPQAKNWFSQLSQTYPDTPAAKSANTQLQMLQKAGY